MTHIKRVNEMQDNGSNESYLDGFAKRNPKIFVSKDCSYYDEYLNAYKELCSKLPKTKSPNDELNIVKYDIENLYMSKCDRNKYNGTLTIPEDVLLNFHNMTSNNYHIELQYEIAKYFYQYSPQMYEFVLYFENMLNVVSKVNNYNSFDAYLIMSELMMLKISIIFGEEIAGQIFTCFV